MVATSCCGSTPFSSQRAYFTSGCGRRTIPSSLEDLRATLAEVPAADPVFDTPQPSPEVASDPQSQDAEDELPPFEETSLGAETDPNLVTSFANEEIGSNGSGEIADELPPFTATASETPASETPTSETPEPVEAAQETPEAAAQESYEPLEEFVAEDPAMPADGLAAGELAESAPDEPLEDQPESTSGFVGETAPEPIGAGQIDDESQRRIDELLTEGQSSFDAGEYQSAIDAWSRVFLIDIDHEEANERIEEARRMAAEAERQVEEVFHEAMSSLDSGDLEEAREALNRVLELQPGHLAAQEYLERIDAGDVVAPEFATPHDTGPLTPAGFDLEESSTSEEGGEDEDVQDLFATPDISPPPAPSMAEIEAEEQKADTGGGARQKFIVVGSAVLLVVLVGGWFLFDNWGRFFPNSEGVQEAPAQPRIDPIARAKKLHEQGKTAIAIAQLRRLPPGDPHYAEAQALVAQWETVGTEVVEEGLLDAEMERHAELVRRAMQAHSRNENLLAERYFRRAESIAPLDAEANTVRADIETQLAPLQEQIQVFRSGDWEFALPVLWRMREADSSNRDVVKLIVDSYYNLGVRDLQRGRPDAALRKFEEALNLQPDDRTLNRLRDFSATYADGRAEDLLYRIFVKYLPFR